MKLTESLIKRLITAAVFIPLIVAAIFYLPSLSFAVVTALIMLLASTEWPRLMGSHSLFNCTLFLTVVIIMMVLTYGLIMSVGYTSWESQLLFMLMLLWWIGAFYAVIVFERSGEMILQTKFLYGVAGIFVIVPCWLGLTLIRDLHHGKFFVLYLLIIIWSADTAAYFIGKRWGNKKLSPRVSPNKTKVGVIGAFGVVLILSLITAILLPLQLWQQVGLVLLSSIIVFFSIVGDLYISVIKRVHNLKDTGTLLPGHGGLLDRLDSLTAGAPIFAIGLILLGLH